MNALTHYAHLMKPAATAAMRRNISTLQHGPIPLKSKMVRFQKNFLSDPSTYPLIIIMGCALTFMTGMGLHALTSYKDVQISPHKRNSMLRTWGKEERPSLLSSVIGWNSWQKHNPEGLGINHEDWLKSKGTK